MCGTFTSEDARLLPVMLAESKWHGTVSDLFITRKGASVLPETVTVCSCRWLVTGGFPLKLHREYHQLRTFRRRSEWLPVCRGALYRGLTVPVLNRTV
jgi:hypothetical protein